MILRLPCKKRLILRKMIYEKIISIDGKRIEIINNEKLNFIVMGNIFSSSRLLVELYDLKGSTHGRKNPEGFCKKDLDLLDKKRIFHIGFENKLNYMKINLQL